MIDSINEKDQSPEKQKDVLRARSKRLKRLAITATKHEWRLLCDQKYKFRKYTMLMVPCRHEIKSPVFWMHYRIELRVLCSDPSFREWIIEHMHLPPGFYIRILRNMDLHGLVSIWEYSAGLKEGKGFELRKKVTEKYYKPMFQP